MDYAMGSMDVAYKGHHVAWPFNGGKTLTDRQNDYNEVHGFYRAVSWEGKEDCLELGTQGGSIFRGGLVYFTVYVCVHISQGHRVLRQLGGFLLVVVIVALFSTMLY